MNQHTSTVPLHNVGSFTSSILWSHCRNEFKSLSHDVISSSPAHCRGNNGDYSPNIQNIWPFSSSLPDDVASAEFSHINSERYRSFLSGLQFQSFTPQQHQSLLNQQQRPTSLQHYSPQQQEISKCVNFTLKVITFYKSASAIRDWHKFVPNYQKVIIGIWRPIRAMRIRQETDEQC
uniref:Uncharacterized protein n=1 Tax=Glossina austeni TaxID=7395 RepID=A0A1A9UZ70_GLOAU